MNQFNIALEPNKIHVFYCDSLPEVDRDGIKAGGYHMHKIDNVIDLGVQMRALGIDSAHAVLVLNDKDLSMSPQFGEEVANNTKTMRGIAGGLFGRSPLDADFDALANTTLKLMGKNPADFAPVKIKFDIEGQEGTGEEDDCRKIDWAKLDELKALNLQENIYMTSGPAVVGDLKKCWGDGHIPVVITGVDSDEVRPYEALGSNGQITAITAMDSFDAQGAHTGRYIKNLEQHGPGFVDHTDSQTPLFDAAFSKVLKANIVRPAGQVITQHDLERDGDSQAR